MIRETAGVTGPATGEGVRRFVSSTKKKEEEVSFCLCLSVGRETTGFHFHLVSLLPLRQFPPRGCSRSIHSPLPGNEHIHVEDDAAGQTSQC